MEMAFYILFVLAVMGLFDILYFHHYKCQLDQHESSRTEVFVHFLRYPIYCFLFVYVANFRFTGFWAIVPAFFYLADLAVAVVDVWIEPASRKAQGGLSPGESILHFIFALLLGQFYYIAFGSLWADLALPNQILNSNLDVPENMKLIMNATGAGCSLLIIDYLLILNSTYDTFRSDLISWFGTSEHDASPGFGNEKTDP